MLYNILGICIFSICTTAENFSVLLQTLDELKYPLNNEKPPHPIKDCTDLSGCEYGHISLILTKESDAAGGEIVLLFGFSSSKIKYAVAHPCTGL